MRPLDPMRPSSSWLWAAACAAVLLCGCRRTPPQPSPDFEEAYRIHEKLYVSQLDEAYGSPQMERAVELLKQVKPASSDHEAAQKLLATIDLGRKELERQHAEDARRRAALRVPVTPGPAIDPAAIVAAALPPTDGGSAPSTPYAGPAAPDPFAPGASIGTLNRELGGCLTGGDSSFTERGSNRVGQVYKISDSRYCQGKAPGLQGQALLVIDGRLYKRVPEKELIVEKGAAPVTVTPTSASGRGAGAAAGGAAAQQPAVAPAGTGAAPAQPPPASSLEYTGPKPEQPQPTY